MATHSRESSQAVRNFVENTSSERPDLGEPLSEDRDDPLLDGERIELDDDAESST